MSSKNKAITRLQGIIIAVIVIIAVIAVAVYFITIRPSHVVTITTTTSTTTVPSTTTTTPVTGSVTVYVAGAYVAILNYLAKQFENATGIQVHVVPGGSFALASQIASQTPVPANVFIPVAYIQAVEL